MKAAGCSSPNLHEEPRSGVRGRDGPRGVRGRDRSGRDGRAIRGRDGRAIHGAGPVHDGPDELWLPLRENDVLDQPHQRRRLEQCGGKFWYSFSSCKAGLLQNLEAATKAKQERRAAAAGTECEQESRRA
jgi:hypothetical protein